MSEEENMDEMNRALAEFTKIPGVGLSKAKKLYEMGYKTVDDLKKASFEELANIKGIGESRATLIKNYFAELEEKERKKEEAKVEGTSEQDKEIKPEGGETKPEIIGDEEKKGEAKPEETVPQEKEEGAGKEEKAEEVGKKEVTETEEEIAKMEKELEEVEKVLETTKGKEAKIVFEKKVKSKEGLINGLKAKPSPRKTKKISPGTKIGVAFLALLLILSSVFVLWYALQPAGRIKVDGSLEDWEGIARYTDTQPVFNMDINLNEYSVYYENERIYFYGRVSGTLFNGANNGYDALIIFVDTDADSNTGYKIENLGADAKIEVSGYAGEIRSAVASRFIEQSASSKPELNYSAWENTGEVRAEKTDKLVEGYAKIAGLNNPVSLVLMRHYEGSAYAEKRGMALVGKTEGSLVVYQNFIGNDVVNADADVLELRLVAKGKAVHVESLSVENANLDLPKKDLGVNEELTVRCKAKSLSDGNAYAFAVSTVDTNVPYRIVGNGGKAYFGSLPSGIVIDGAFGDWQSVQKGVDVSGDADKNIDLREYASAIAGKAYFYMAVDGTMLAGCEIPVLGARPPVQPGPPIPVVIKENLGMDVARVYIDLMNSTINTFNPAMISHGYLIELQGRNGQVISAKAWKWENGVKAEEIQNPNIAHGLSDGKIEFSVSGTALQGLTNDTKFYFEMTNWLGEKDACELSYLVGMVQTRVGGDGSYGSSLLNEFTGSYNKVVLVNDRYTATTKGALRLENNTVQYGGPGVPAPLDGNLTVSGTVYWNGTYYFRHLKITSTGNITASGYLTVIRIYAEVIEIEAGGTIYLAGKGGKGGLPGAADGGDGTSGQDGNDGTGPGGSTPPNADGGGGGGGLINTNNYGGNGGGGGAFAGNGGTGGQGAKDGGLGGGTPGTGGSAYASIDVLKPGSGGGGGSGGQGGGSAAGGDGGSGGGAILLNAWNIHINGRIITNGTNGGDGVSGDRPGGGGGGGSGGCIMIQGCNVTIGANAELNASGGKGGNAGEDSHDAGTDDEAGGGGGGGGGAIWIYADNAYSENSGAKFDVSGGAGGLGSVGAPSSLNNNGANGTAGNITKPTSSTPPNPRTTFTSNLSYALSGYYVSQVLDAGRISLWRSITWTRDTHWSGTQLVLRVRWGNTSLPDATWHAWQDVNGTMSGGTGPLSETFALNTANYPFARFFQYNITLSTSIQMNSPTVYGVSLLYSKPKLLISSVVFNPFPLGVANHSVVLANNDSFPVTFSEIYLNTSANSFSTPIYLAPGAKITVTLPAYFFQLVNNSGDFLFLNDSTSSISGISPNGIIDFVNWTDGNGGEPPSCGNHAASQNEWSNGPVNLTGFDPLTQIGINRTVIMDAPVDSDKKTDWYVVVEEQTGLLPWMLILILLGCIILQRKCSRKLRKL
ncbi:MAG: helix-hairpin-helix domain-containing protein [Thermoplasmata archaeon]